MKRHFALISLLPNPNGSASDSIAYGSNDSMYGHVIRPEAHFAPTFYSVPPHISNFAFHQLSDNATEIEIAEKLSLPCHGYMSGTRTDFDVCQQRKVHEKAYVCGRAVRRPSRFLLFQVRRQRARWENKRVVEDLLGNSGIYVCARRMKVGARAIQVASDVC